MAVSLETEIRDLCSQSAYDRAAQRGLETYGEELLGYLVAVLRDADAAGEVFSMLGEDLWRGLPEFGWRCSFRTWLYTLARHAASRYRRAPHRRPGRQLPVSQVSELVDRVRTRTLPYLRTEVKDRFAALREALDPDDQSLLILRVNRGLSWDEVARIMADAQEPSADELKKVSARLRKRFQLVKQELRARAEQSGLLESAPE